MGIDLRQKNGHVFTDDHDNQEHGDAEVNCLSQAFRQITVRIQLEDRHMRSI